MDRWIKKEIVKNLGLYYERPPSIKLDDNPVSKSRVDYVSHTKPEPSSDT